MFIYSIWFSPIAILNSKKTEGTSVGTGVRGIKYLTPTLTNKTAFR
jgi:hypothetical protein